MPGDSYNPFDTTQPIIPEVFGYEAYAERKLPDGILATWERSPLPEDAVVSHVTLVPYRGERPVLAWRDGRAWLPEGDVHPGEDVDGAIQRIALEQAGISTLRARHLGHLRTRTTVYTQKVPQGTVTFMPLYVVEVQELADFPSDPAYERRQFTQRDMNELVRSHYVELRREYMDVLDLFVLELHKAAARAAAD